MWNEWGWLWPALVASALMSIALVPIGHRVLARGMVFADLAVAQWAALGMLLASNVFPGDSSTIRLTGSLALALAAAAVVHQILRRLTRHREAMIGLLYVTAACTATLLVSTDPHGAQRLVQALDGDLLWSTPLSLIPIAVLALAVVIWQLSLSEQLADKLFLPLFAIAITLTVDLAGVYVVFTTLIAAPLLLSHLRGYSIALASLACLYGHAFGLFISAWQDLPTGPTVVIATILTSALLAAIIRGPVVKAAW